jgi:hypothetical protein
MEATRFSFSSPEPAIRERCVSDLAAAAFDQLAKFGEPLGHRLELFLHCLARAFLDRQHGADFVHAGGGAGFFGEQVLDAGLAVLDAGAQVVEFGAGGGGFAVEAFGVGGGLVDALAQLVDFPAELLQAGGELFDFAAQHGGLAVEGGAVDGALLELGAQGLELAGQLAGLVGPGGFLAFEAGDGALEFGYLFGKGADFVVSLEHRGGLAGAAAAGEQAFGADHVAFEGGEAQVGQARAKAQRRRQVGHDQHPAQQAFKQGPVRRGHGNFVHRPANRPLRHGQHLAGAAVWNQVAGGEAGGAQRAFAEQVEHAGGEGRVGDQDGLEVFAEGGFDGAHQLVGHDQVLGDQPAQSIFEKVGFVEAGQDGLGAGVEAFARGDQAAHHFEARGFFGKQAALGGQALADGGEFGTGLAVVAVAAIGFHAQACEFFIHRLETFGEAGGFFLLVGEAFPGAGGVCGEVVQARLIAAALLAGGIGAGEQAGEAGFRGLGGVAGGGELADGFGALPLEGEGVFLGGGDFGALRRDPLAHAGQGLVGGPQVELLLVDARLGVGDVGGVGGDHVVPFALAFLVALDAGFGGAGAVVLLVEGLAGVADLIVEAGQFEARRIDGRFAAFQLPFEGGNLPAQRGDARFQLGSLRRQLGVMLVGMVRVEHPHVGKQGLVAARLGGLALQGIHLAADLGEDVGEPQQVGFGIFQLAQGFLFLPLEFGDAGGFLEDCAAVLGFRRQQHVDLALGHDRITGATDPGVHEQVLDILEAAGLAVEQILRAAVAEHPAPDRDFVEIHAQGCFAFGESERHLGHAQRFAPIGAGKNHIGHFGAAQGFGRGLAEHPADGIHDVGFATAVGPDNAGDPGVEFEVGLVGEGLEAIEFEAFQVHVGRKRATGWLLGWADPASEAGGRQLRAVFHHTQWAPARQEQKHNILWFWVRSGHNI